MGKIIRGMSMDRNVRFLAVDATAIVEEARKLHRTAPTATVAMGRTLTACVLLGKLLKGDNDRVTLQIRGKGLIKSLVAVSDSHGTVKGYVSDPEVNLVTAENPGFQVGRAVGNEGQMIVIKDFGLKEPFVGRTDLVSGEIAEDLAAYFMYSEQQPSIVSLGVELDDTGVVVRAGGMIVQPMPYAPDETIDALEKAAMEMETFSRLQSKSQSLEDVVHLALPELEIEVMDEDPVAFRCDCTREKTETALESIGKSELQKIIDEDGKADLHCHFCNKTYVFSLEDLETLISNAKE